MVLFYRKNITKGLNMTTASKGLKRRKEYKHLTIRMDKTVHEGATEYAKKHGKNRTAVIEEAVTFYLNRAEFERELRKKIANEIADKMANRRKELLLQGLY